MTTEGIVYLLRKTNLNRETIGKLTIPQFNEILKEVYYQESIEEYSRAYSVALLQAAIYNTIPRKRGSKVYQAKDFLKSNMPERNPQMDSLDKIAEDKGIKMPTKELKER